MKSFKLAIFTLIVYGAMLFPVFAQEKSASTSDNDKAKVQSDYYSVLSVGANSPIYRDFATSPLFYSGLGLGVQKGWLKRSEERERLFDIGIVANTVSAQIPESNFLQPSTSGFFGQLNLRYLQLWELKKLSNKNNNIKLGGVLRTTQNFRLNTNLFNNATGLENMTNVMASGKITRDVSRKTERTLNLWLFKSTLKPVKRELRFQIDVGILNLNYRPGYAYTYAGELVGLETNPLNWVLSNYRWSLNGWRFNAEWEYITYLPNGNATSWSYVWDAANAPGRFESFQMASHQIRYTYYFNTKTR
jgi:hypothetical protein